MADVLRQLDVHAEHVHRRGRGDRLRLHVIAQRFADLLDQARRQRTVEAEQNALLGVALLQGKQVNGEHEKSAKAGVRSIGAGVRLCESTRESWVRACPNGYATEPTRGTDLAGSAQSGVRELARALDALGRLKTASSKAVASHRTPKMGVCAPHIHGNPPTLRTMAVQCLTVFLAASTRNARTLMSSRWAMRP